MEKAFTVTPTIEQSQPHGCTLVLQAGDVIWWKWYENEPVACREAERLDLAVREYLPQGKTATVRCSLKASGLVNEDDLIGFNFRTGDRPPRRDV